MLDRGLLRTDGGGPDAPYDARILAQDFIRIALWDEYAPAAPAPPWRARRPTICAAGPARSGCR